MRVSPELEAMFKSLQETGELFTLDKEKYPNVIPFKGESELKKYFRELSMPGPRNAAKVLNAVFKRLANAKVDTWEQTIIWEDGKHLSMVDSVQRFMGEYPEYSLPLVEKYIFTWIEDAYSLEDEVYTPAMLAEFDRRVEAWAAEYMAMRG